MDSRIGRSRRCYDNVTVKYAQSPRRQRAPASLTVRWRRKCLVRTSRSADARSYAGLRWDVLRRRGSASATAVWANSSSTFGHYLNQPSRRRGAVRTDRARARPADRFRYTASRSRRVPDLASSSYSRLKLYCNCAVSRLWPLNRPRPCCLLLPNTSTSFMSDYPGRCVLRFKRRGRKNFSAPSGFYWSSRCDDGARLSQRLPQHLGISIIARRGLGQDWNALREVLS